MTELYGNTLLAKETPIVDLNRAHFDHRVGRIRVIGTWMNKTSENSYAGPCLALISRKRSLHDCVPCLIPLDNAWRWAEETGEEVWAATMAFGFCGPLDLNVMETRDVIEILSAVRSRLSDLLNMPPQPPKERQLAGDIGVTVGEDGKTIRKDLWLPS